MKSGQSRLFKMAILGLKNYRDGDFIEIADIRSASLRLEQGDSIVLSG